MYFKESNVHSVPDLLRRVEERQRRRSIPIWFRGSTNKDYDLVPSLGRPPYQLDQEKALINVFKQNAVQFVEQRPPSEWEWLFLARHHSVPTRLLDWTESPLIGLYFAVHSIDDSKGDDSKDGVVWLLLPTDLNRRSNIILLDKGSLPMFEDDDEYLSNYLPSVLASETQTSVVRHS